MSEDGSKESALFETTKSMLGSSKDSSKESALFETTKRMLGCSKDITEGDVSWRVNGVAIWYKEASVIG